MCKKNFLTLPGEVFVETFNLLGLLLVLVQVISYETEKK